MAFVSLQDDNQWTTYLYAANRRGLTSYACNPNDKFFTSALNAAKTSSNPQSYQARVLDERKVDVNCAAINPMNGEIAIAQQDAVYFYTVEDRGMCFAFDGVKQYIAFFKHYLLIVHQDLRQNIQLNVYDLKNKFIAFNCTFGTHTTGRKKKTAASEKENIRFIVAEFGSIFIGTSIGNVRSNSNIM